MTWDTEQSSNLYGIDAWGAGYFKINESGNVSVCPQGNDGPTIDLRELTEELKERGIRLPLTIRFQDILKARVHLLCNCFAKTIDEYGYKGTYSPVYPIKVNQQRFVVGELMKYGADLNLGLECGSKPELLVILSQMKNREALIVCNGFKDAEYVETAMLARKLGLKVFIVVDRFEELPMIIKAANKFNTKAMIGFRCKLNAKAAGRWVESSGAHSKFGLTSSEIVKCIQILKEANMLKSLQLLHYHIGSQIPSIQYIKTALKEAARFFTELNHLGAEMSYIDVGGGLGVDYDGSGSSTSSMNYTEQEYANDVVSIIQDICDEQDVPHPTIITEAGRSLTAHHSVLIFDILGSNSFRRIQKPPAPKEDDHSTLHDLYYILQNITAKNLNESFNDLVQTNQDVQQLFSYGVLDLQQRARAEDMYWSICTTMEKLAKTDEEEYADILTHLQAELADLYFGNFSVFQSLPDSWAVDQIFPVMPIEKLNEEPTQLATLGDLTCDSDGKISTFICTETWETRNTLRVHPLTDQPYHFAVFLIGAYQEILGDLHNLFGDTDSVNVSVREDGYSIDHVVKGDTVGEILSYLEYPKEKIINSIRRFSEEAIFRKEMTKPEARLLMKYYEEGLEGYTYLEESED